MFCYDKQYIVVSKATNIKHLGPLKLNSEVHAFANYSRVPSGFNWDEPMNRAGFRHENDDFNGDL